MSPIRRLFPSFRRSLLILASPLVGWLAMALPTRGGVVDESFVVRPALDSAPRTVAVQPDGKILIGGSFLILNQGVAQLGLARLNADGSLDQTFKPPASFNPNGAVSALAVQPDGEILVSGSLVTAPTGTGPSIVRLTATGALDRTFTAPLLSPPDHVVPPQQILLTTDGKILLVDRATVLTRLNADGSLDSTFVQTQITLTAMSPTGVGNNLAPETSTAGISFTTLQTDGKILVAAAAGFTDFNGTNIPRHGFTLQRFNPNGTLDSTFSPVTFIPAAGSIHADVTTPLALRQLANGNIIAVLPAPIFTNSYANRISSTGVLDASYAPPRPNRLIYASAGAIDAAGRVWLSGNSEVPFGLQRFTPSGELDATLVFPTGFEPFNSAPTSIVTYDDGRALVAGPFATIDGITRPFLARLNATSNGGALPPAIISITPASTTVPAGQDTVINIAASGTPPLTFTVTGPDGRSATATTGTVTFPNVQQTGTYVVTVSAAGSANATGNFFLTITPSAPVITRQPASQDVDLRDPATLTVGITGSDPRTYQWFKNDERIAGATGASLTLPSVSANDVGSYTVVVRNSLGIAASQTVRLEIALRLTNLSTRGWTAPGENTMIAGFVLRAPTTILSRGIGPTLATFGVPNVLPNPKLLIYDANGAVTVGNDDWDIPIGPTPQMFADVGAFPLPRGSTDAALAWTLPAGSYTAQLTGVGGNVSGNALLELYEQAGTTARFVNLSTRLFVGGSGSEAIAGFTLTGSAGATPRRILIRAVGPTLADFGIAAPLPNPTLSVLDQSKSVLATNDDWAGDRTLADAFASAGAFALPAASKDAAVIVAVPAGSYTAVVRDPSGGTGVALLEVYELP